MTKESEILNVKNSRFLENIEFERLQLEDLAKFDGSLIGTLKEGSEVNKQAEVLFEDKQTFEIIEELLTSPFVPNMLQKQNLATYFANTRTSEIQKYLSFFARDLLAKKIQMMLKKFLVFQSSETEVLTFYLVLKSNLANLSNLLQNGHILAVERFLKAYLKNDIDFSKLKLESIDSFIEKYLENSGLVKVETNLRFTKADDAEKALEYLEYKAVLSNGIFKDFEGLFPVEKIEAYYTNIYNEAANLVQNNYYHLGYDTALKHLFDSFNPRNMDIALPESAINSMEKKFIATLAKILAEDISGKAYDFLNYPSFLELVEANPELVKEIDDFIFNVM